MEIPDFQSVNVQVILKLYGFKKIVYNQLKCVYWGCMSEREFDVKCTYIIKHWHNGADINEVVKELNKTNIGKVAINVNCNLCKCLKSKQSGIVCY